MKIQPSEVKFLYRTTIALLILLGLALFVILCFIAKVYLPACVVALENLGSNFGIQW